MADPTEPRRRPVLLRRLGGPLTAFYLRLLGGLALLGIAVILLAPARADLVPYVALAIFFNGPQSPLFAATFEPVLLLYGTLYPALVIAALGTAGNVVAEAVNYRLFVAAAETRTLQRVHETRVVRWTTAAFRRMPFVTVAVVAAAFPLWIARVLVALSRYPIERHLTAVALGRFPRFWAFASLGRVIGIPTRWLVGIVLALLLFTGLVLVRRRVRANGTAPPPG